MLSQKVIYNFFSQDRVYFWLLELESISTCFEDSIRPTKGFKIMWWATVLREMPNVKAEGK